MYSASQIFRYLFQTIAIVFIIVTIKSIKFHLSSIIVTKAGLFGNVIYSSADAQCWDKLTLPISMLERWYLIHLRAETMGNTAMLVWWRDLKHLPCRTHFYTSKKNQKSTFLEGPWPNLSTPHQAERHPIRAHAIVVTSHIHSTFDITEAYFIKLEIWPNTRISHTFSKFLFLVCLWNVQLLWQKTLNEQQEIPCVFSWHCANWRCRGWNSSCSYQNPHYDVA